MFFSNIEIFIFFWANIFDFFKQKKISNNKILKINNKFK